MQLEVKNAAEVTRALDAFAKSATDLTDVNADVGNLLLPDIQRHTRRATGALAASWESTAEPLQAAFSNPQKYAVVQEFGGVEIEPTNAVAQAFKGNEDGVSSAYGSGLAKRAERIGFDTKGG
jgi:hypothetical protein